VGFEGDDDEILYAEFGGRIAAPKLRDMLLSVDAEPQSAFPHRRQVGASGNHAQVDIGARQLYRHQTPDGARAEDADLHAASSASRLRFGL